MEFQCQADNVILDDISLREGTYKDTEGKNKSWARKLGGGNRKEMCGGEHGSSERPKKKKG